MLLIGSIAVLFPASAIAQTSLSLSVSPTVFQMTANPGQIWESSLRIINNNPYEITVFVDVTNFRPLGEQGASEFIPINESDGAETTLAEWINVPSTAIIIPPEQTSEIPIIIELPEEVPPGGHYAAVLVGTRPPETREDISKVETAQVVTSLVFLRVSGDVVEEGNIRTFRTLDSVVESPEATFELRFQNSGNVHLRPEGEITIFNMWGQERGVIPVNQKTLFGNVLSDSVRSFNFTWKGEWSPADIGLYSAEAVLAYGDEQINFATADTRFWVIPWRILLSIIVSLGIIIFLMVWLIKLYVRRVLTLSGVGEETQSGVTTNTARQREISIVAPIEAGILDLRSRFSNRQTSKLEIMFKFIIEYKVFFVGLLVIGFVIYIFSWFVSSVSDDNRAFEVTVSGRGQDVTVDSESLQYDNQQPTTEISKLDVPPIELVNRSGVNGAAAKVALGLEELGYTINNVSTELNVIEERTVIVHDPLVTAEAIDLSALLDSALVSPFTSDSDDDPLITIYIGVDMAN